MNRTPGIHPGQQKSGHFQYLPSGQKRPSNAQEEKAGKVIIALHLKFLCAISSESYCTCAPVAQLDRALDFESIGRPFESGRAYHYNTKGFQLLAENLFCFCVRLSHELGIERFNGISFGITN